MVAIITMAIALLVAIALGVTIEKQRNRGFKVQSAILQAANESLMESLEESQKFCEELACELKLAVEEPVKKKRIYKKNRRK